MISDDQVVKRANAAVRLELEKRKPEISRLLYLIEKRRRYICRIATERS